VRPAGAPKEEEPRAAEDVQADIGSEDASVSAERDRTVPHGNLRSNGTSIGYKWPDKITRLHQILNDAGSFAHLASYVKKEGVPSGSRRTALKNLAKSLRQIIEFNDQLDWQSNESVAAGYAKEGPIFTASADRISSEFYSQRDRDVAGMRRYAEAVAFAEAHLNTSSKSTLGIEIRQTKYIIEAY
jgi:hypothetical protein